jgi:hypothetical protein
MTAPTVEALDRRIANLRTTIERIVQNLVELDADVTRQMLDTSFSLTGQTAAQWNEAQRRLSFLWSGQQALDDTLERVSRDRGSKSFLSRATVGRLTNLLDGPSVAVARPDAQRGLTEGSVPTDTFTVDDVISRMSSDYELVMALLNEVAAVWALIVPRLEALAAMVAELEAAADAHAIRRPNNLTLARRALDDAGDLSRCDPLAVSGEVLAPITTMIEAASTSLRESVAMHEKLQDNLAAGATALDECGQALERTRALQAEVAGKVVLHNEERTRLAQVGGVLDELRRELAEATRLAATSPTDAAFGLRALLRRVDDLRAQLDDLQETARSAVAAREELRGRLDAYRAKAQAVGQGEDIELHRLYAEARDVLFSAPCDLVEAGALVTAYRRSILAQPILAQPKGASLWPTA